MIRPAGGTSAVIRQPSFRLLLGGELISNLGDGVFLVALPWYVLARHGGGPLLLGEVLTAYGVPRTALLVLGGHASDRYRPWTVMLVANCARGLAVMALAASAAVGTGQGPDLVAIAIVLGAAEGVFIPASESIVPTLLGSEQLRSGNALISGTTQISQLAGPAIGGVLVATLGTLNCFVIDAASFAVSALTLVGLRRSAPRSAAGGLQRQPVAAVSMRDLLAQPVMRLLLVTDALVNLGSAGMGRVALPALARGPLHLQAGGFGALNAAMGAGLLLGTIAACVLPVARRPFLLASLALLSSAPLIAALPYGGGWISSAVILMLAFILIAIGNLLLVTAFQQWAPVEVLGRLTGVLMLASIGMMPLSTLIAGVAIHLVGARAYFPLDAVSVVVAATVQLSSPAWRRFDPAAGS